MHLSNCTPHRIILFTPRGPLHLPTGDHPARLLDEPGAQHIPLGLPVPVHERTFGTTIDGLPHPHPATFYIVSRAVAAACPDRDDLLVPGPLVVSPPHGVAGCAVLYRFRRPQRASTE